MSLGHSNCWFGEVNYDVCCRQFQGRSACFDFDFTYFRCCLTKDGWNLDHMSLASALSLAPSSLSHGQDLNCFGQEPWDELAITLQSMNGLGFSKLAPGRLVESLARSIFGRPDFGLRECPLGVIALSITLMVLNRVQEQVFRAFSAAVSHLMRQLGNDIALLSSTRWPIFRQFAFLEKSPEFAWSPELAALKFICIPKTGGTSIQQYGLRHGYVSWAEGGGGGYCSIAHCSADLWEHDPEITFCVVRNPYERVLSAALWRGVKTADELNTWVHENVGQAWKKIDVEDNLVLPSHAFVISRRGERKCKHILHTENLSAEFCEFIVVRSQILDFEACIEEMNWLPTNINLKRQLAVTDFSNLSISLINSVFQIDFNMFGYKLLYDSVAVQSLRVPRPYATRGWMDDLGGRRISRYRGGDMMS